jgi:DNA gyrase inhibitor GyrI
MNIAKVYRMSLLTLLVLGLPMLINGQSYQATAELKPAEVKAVRAAAANPKATTVFAVTMDVEGNFDTVDEAMAKFEREAKAQNVANASPVGVLILYEDPEGKSSFRMSVGVTLSKRVEVKEPLKVGQYKFTAARHVVTGPYQKLSPVGRTLHAAIKERATRYSAAAKANTNAPFAVLRLLNDPKKVKPEQLRTELIVPIRAQ